MIVQLLNIITIFIVAMFVVFVYLAYKTRPVENHSSTPLDVFKTLVEYGPNMRQSISQLAHGDIGNFEGLDTTDDNWTS